MRLPSKSRENRKHLRRGNDRSAESRLRREEDIRSRTEVMAEVGLSVEEILEKLRRADTLLRQGKNVPTVVKALGVTEVLYYRWRREYGGMSVAQARRLKALERENRQLRRTVADLTLDKLILQKAAKETF